MIHTFTGGTGYVFFHHLSNVVHKHHTIESPALVSSCYLLSHGCEEALRVEESCHPETGGSAIEQPGGKLSISVQQVGEPETKRSRRPRDLKSRTYGYNQTQQKTTIRKVQIKMLRKKVDSAPTSLRWTNPTWDKVGPRVEVGQEFSCVYNALCKSVKAVFCRGL